MRENKYITYIIILKGNHSVYICVFYSIVLSQTKKLIDFDDVIIHIEGIGFKLEAKDWFVKKKIYVIQ
jgi:hypothetical protein